MLKQLLAATVFFAVITVCTAQGKPPSHLVNVTTFIGRCLRDSCVNVSQTAADVITIIVVIADDAQQTQLRKYLNATGSIFVGIAIDLSKLVPKVTEDSDSDTDSESQDPDKADPYLLELIAGGLRSFGDNLITLSKSNTLITNANLESAMTGLLCNMGLGLSRMTNGYLAAIINAIILAGEENKKRGILTQLCASNTAGAVDNIVNHWLPNVDSDTLTRPVNTVSKVVSAVVGQPLS